MAFPGTTDGPAVLEALSFPAVELGTVALGGANGLVSGRADALSADFLSDVVSPDAGALKPALVESFSPWGLPLAAPLPRRVWANGSSTIIAGLAGCESVEEELAPERFHAICGSSAGLAAIDFSRGDGS